MKPTPTNPPHTPTPWKADGPDMLGSDGLSWIATTSKGNAAFIVRAVNVHEELLEAARDALKCLDRVQGADRIGIKLSAAIAKAEGRS